MEEEIQRCKHVANQRILALETKYVDAMDDNNTAMSKMQCHHAKVIRGYESNATSQMQKLQKDHTRIISGIECQTASSQYCTNHEHTKTVVSLQNGIKNINQKAQ